MSKASDDLKKMLHSLYLSQQVRSHHSHHEAEPNGQATTAAAKPKVSPSAPVIGRDDRVMIFLAVAGICSFLSLIGALLSQGVMAGLGAVGGLVGVAGLGLIWQKAMLFAGEGSSDTAVEIIKRKSLEMERDRMKGELKDSLRSLEKMNQRILQLREETVQVRAEKSEWIVMKERDIRQQVELEKEKLRHETEVEKENLKRTLLEQQKQDSDILHREASEREKLLAQSAARELQQLKQEVANREKKLSEMGAQIVSLQDALDNAAVASPKALAAHMSAQNKAFDEERKEFEQRTQAQEQVFQQKLAELKALHERDRQGLEKKLDEINAQNVKLQEAFNRKVASTSAEVTQHVEEVDKAFESQKEAMHKKFMEQETLYQKKLEDQEEKFNAQRLELLAACEGFLTELQAREDALEKREKEPEKAGN